ncbi:hypothetical protein B0675_03125 [Streptomyces sp. M41(2017)]|nr:hypothetical protein B0675_03125 [Streptomyces sp. M41(2017)]
MAVRHDAWAPQDVRKDGRRRNARLRGEGVGLDYRPSPRQLRRSSPKRMMLRSLAESRWSRGAVSVCGITGGEEDKTCGIPLPSGRSGSLSPHFTNHGCRW